jgi:hypothetical protein
MAPLTVMMQRPLRRRLLVDVLVLKSASERHACLVHPRAAVHAHLRRYHVMTMMALVRAGGVGVVAM